MARRKKGQIPAHLHGAAKRYLWAAGSRMLGDAQKIGEHIDTIMVKHGGQIEAEDVLKDAKKKSSPLHNYFEWDDAAAANEYRLGQARKILRSITVENVDPETEEATVIRAFMVPDEQKRGPDRLGGYRPIESILSNPDLREMKVQEAWAQLVAWKSRYEGISELADVFRLIEQGPPPVKKKAVALKK